MDAEAAREVLDMWVASKRLPPYNKPNEGMAGVARRLRLVEASREVAARERAVEQTLMQLARRGRVLDGRRHSVPPAGPPNSA